MGQAFSKFENIQGDNILVKGYNMWLQYVIGTPTIICRILWTMVVGDQAAIELKKTFEDHHG